MSQEIKGQPRHEFNEDGEYTALDTCAVELGSRMVVVTELGKAIAATTFVRTAAERGAMHDWYIQETPEEHVALTHSHPQEQATFIDRSVILKLGNELSYNPWDDHKSVQLGRIIGLTIEHPYEVDEMRATVVELPYSEQTVLDTAA